MKICKKCIMPESKPHVIISEDGICNICKKDAEVRKNIKHIENSLKDNKIEILKKKIQRYKGDGKYDCAVSVSGGKDSIMTLYIAKKVLNLNPLAIFIDNGFACEEMYDNVKNATDILKVDLIMFKTAKVSQMFNYLLESKKQIYYCRVCHTLIDYYIKDFCKQNNINIVLGGYTKGQMYIKNFELYWIYDISDKNVIELFEKNDNFKDLVPLFKNPKAYFSENYGNIIEMSPFKYVKWDEDEILNLITKELKFKLPKKSWPNKSSNCSFNFVAQHLAIQQFGYAQHEVELSNLVRSGELTRERAEEIINSPITREDMDISLNKLGVKLEDIEI